MQDNREIFGKQLRGIVLQNDPYFDVSKGFTVYATVGEDGLADVAVYGGIATPPPTTGGDTAEVTFTMTGNVTPLVMDGEGRLHVAVESPAEEAPTEEPAPQPKRAPRAKKGS